MRYLTKEDINRAKENGINSKQLYNRFYILLWDLEEAVTRPVGIGRRSPSAYKEYKELCDQNGICREVFDYRIREVGMTPYDAATTKSLKRGRKAVIPEKYKKMAEENGICFTTLKSRIYTLHWSYEDAATRPIRKGWKR